MPDNTRNELLADREWLERMALAADSVTQIAAAAKSSVSAASRALAEHGIDPPHQPWEQVLTRDYLVSLGDMTLVDMAAETGAAKETVWLYLVRHGLRKHESSVSLTDVRAKYEGGMTVADLAADSSISKRKARALIRESGAEMRTRGPRSAASS